MIRASMTCRHDSTHERVREITLADVRANQFPMIVHGTSRRIYETIILSGGLSKMHGRYIHFATTDLSVCKSGAQILIYIDLLRAIQEGGVRFYVSQSGLVLSLGDKRGILSSRFFARMVHLGN